MSSTVGVTCLLLLLSHAVGQQMCDHCNCQISSLTESQAIYSLTLICNTGSITWFGASGAIRIELTPFLRGNIRACFLADSDNTQVQIYQENPHVISHRNYRFTGKGSRTLKLDRLLTSSSKTHAFCFNANSRQPLLLYIEAVRRPGLDGVAKIVFHYDLEKLGMHALADPMEDCRPCSKEEVLDSYCSMDFVVVGNLLHVQNSDATEQSNITIAVKQVVHYKKNHQYSWNKCMGAPIASCKYEAIKKSVVA